jgi:branched-chain amino acid transport system permease protein
MFQAAGAYTAAVLTLGSPEASGNFQRYIAGMSLPFPLPILAAALVGAALSLLIGFITLRRLRSDYQAMVMLVVSVIATTVVVNDTGLFNGPAGLSTVPQPLNDVLNLSPLDYQWFYVALTLGICTAAYFVVHRITSSPLGRVLRAVRDNSDAAAALGKDVTWLRLFAFMVGGAIAAVSGAVLVQFIGAWAPGGWLYPETFVLLAAVIIGGRGNNLGSIMGALLVPVAFLEATRFLPPIGRSGLIDALQWVVIGVLLLVFLWFRPQGIFPERKRLYDQAGVPKRAWKR